MINYELKDQFIRVKWNKKELGRIYRETDEATSRDLWVYKPIGCGGKIRSEGFFSLQDLKHNLEYGENESV